MRFLVDAQLPPAFARWLATKGHTAEHVADRGLDRATDAAIWTMALGLGAVIITKDADFAKRKALSDNGPPVVWLRLPNTRRTELLAWFDTAFLTIILELERGEKLIEVV